MTAADKLEMCPFCGRGPATGMGQLGLDTPKFKAVFCRCTNFYRMPLIKWNNAWAWREIDRLKNKLREAGINPEVNNGSL